MTSDSLTAHMDPVVVCGPERMLMANMLQLLPEDRLVAWAEKLPNVIPAPDRAFMLARYVHGGLPANRNGHLFRTEQLREAHKLIPNTSLNVLHQSHDIVGAHIASELVFPLEPDDGSIAAADQVSYAPYVEVVPVVWRELFPRFYEELVRAQRDGQAWVSMEARPSDVTCAVCGFTTKFDGPRSATYDDHMNSGQGMWAENPHFLGGGVILPPAKPGWADADITNVQLAATAEANADESQRVLDQVTVRRPDLAASDAESLMTQLIAAVHPVVEPAVTVAAGWPRSDVVTVLAETRMAELIRSVAEADRWHAVMVPVPADVSAAVYEQSPVAATEKEPHVTVALVSGDQDPGVFVDAVQAWADAEGPFDALVGGSSTIFENGTERPFVADVESPGLHEARARLFERFAQAGLTPGGRGVNDYHPHMTITYLDGDAGSPRLGGEGVPFTVSGVVVSLADRSTVDVGFG